MDLSGGPLPKAGGKLLRPFRVFIRLCAWMLQTNPLGWVLRQHPNHLLFATWAIGLLLLLWSYLLGVDRFDVEVQFLFDHPKGHAGKEIQPEVRTLATGYIQELNYGPWYGLPFLCPAVYCLAGIITRISSRNGSAKYSFLPLMAKPLGRAVG